MRGVPVRAGTAVALALLLAGCGGGSTGPTANPNARSAEPARTAPAPSSFAPRSLPPASSPGASARDQRIVVTGYTGFASPSGNIRCGISPTDDYVRCDIAEREWEPPPPPEECELDYGSGLEVDADGAGVVCAGDAVGASELVLEYGERLQGGQVLCESSEDGMRCEHLETGNGFALARADYELF